MEADLQRFYAVDYRDRWHPDRRRRLTLRRLWVLLTHLPSDAALVRAMGDGQPVFDLEHVLLADIWQAVQGAKAKPHPLLRDARRAVKTTKRHTAERRRKLADARRRAQERRRAG